MNPLGSQSNRPWKRLAAVARALAPILLAAAALAGSLLVPVRAGLAQNPASGDTLVYELAGNRWFEFPGTIVSFSSDASSAIFFGGLGHTQLIALPSGRPDPETLRGGLDKIAAAAFCGRNGFIRLGSRGTESGIFWPSPDGAELSTLPSDAVPTCSPDGKELAYYTLSAADRTIYVGTRGAFRSYGLGGTVTSMAFSPDGNIFYDIVFQPNGESVLGRIEVATGKTRTIAAHLDAAPDPGKIAITPDGKAAYIALAGDGPPNNEARHNPNADRWLKIYEINLATGARRRVVEAPGQDLNDPAIAAGNLYWARTVVQNSIVAVPIIGGDAKEVVAASDAKNNVAGGQLPMWAPDGKRIAYTFGGWRLADWALNLDDAVISVDENAQRTSDPFIIVSGYHEDFPPAWSPDGKWIAFHSHRSQKPVPEYSSAGSTDDIYLRLAGDAHAPELRLTDFGWETGPAYWSPDGQKLLFSSWQRGGEAGIDKLFILTLDTETGAALKAEMLPLPAQIRSAQWAAWSPDGKEIAIEDNRGGNKRTLWVRHSDGSNAEKLLDYEGTSYGGLDWTHDGKAIIFAALSHENDRLQIFSELRSGGEPRQLTHDSGNIMHPRVSPDGRWIACTRIVESKQIWRRPLP